MGAPQRQKFALHLLQLPLGLLPLRFGCKLLMQLLSAGILNPIAAPQKEAEGGCVLGWP